MTLDVTKYGEFSDQMMGHRIGYGANEGEFVEQQETADAAAG